MKETRDKGSKMTTDENKTREEERKGQKRRQHDTTDMGEKDKVGEQKA